MPKIIIVGAGISGLSLAYRLQQRRPDADILLLEQGDRPGGTTWTMRQDGFQLEIGPNGFLDNKQSTLDLCQDLGLSDRLVPASETASKKRYLFMGDRLHMLPSGPGSFFASGLFSWPGKFSFILERFRRSRPLQGPWTDEADETIDAFVRRRAGAEAADVLADAFVTGIFGGDPKLLSMRACLPRLWEWEQEHGSVIKGMFKSAKKKRLDAKKAGKPYRRGIRLMSFGDGLRLLIETLSQNLKQPPQLGVNVQRVRRLGGLTPPAQKNQPGWIVEAEGRDSWQADIVILSCPAYQQAALLADEDPQLCNLLNEIPFCPVAVVGLGFPRVEVEKAADGFGFIAPQRDRRDVLGVQWCASLYPRRAPDGAFSMRALCGGWNRADVVSWDDARLLEAVRNELRLAMGITATPIFHQIIRWPRAIPQYHVGHLTRCLKIEQRLGDGLFLTGNSFYGVGLNDCTERSDQLAGEVVDYLDKQG